MRSLTAVCALSLMVFCVTGATAGVLLEPKPAPAWKVSEWLGEDPGAIKQNRGKVILIHFFQLWCPGCNEFSIPLFEKWAEEFGSRGDVLVVSIHTVFEGHDEQTPERLRQFVKEKEITIPVGIDTYDTPGAPVPVTMDRFETGGTPHVVIIDKVGLLRFSHFGRFDPEPVERFITRILEENDKVKSNTRGGSPGKTPAATSKKKTRTSNPRKERRTPPPRPDPADPPESEPAPDDASESEPAPDDEENTPEKPDPELSGSYKLRFEQLSKSCGDLVQPIEVITQVAVQEDRIVTTFSRPFLGIRQLTAQYDGSAGHFEATLEQQAQEKGGVTVDLSLQLSGRFVSIVDPPQLEFDYYLDERSEDGGLDCTIEGRGGGSRFRSR